MKNLQKKYQKEQKKQNKKVKLFIQVNIGDEDQKSGVSKKDLKNLYDYCKNLEIRIYWFDVYSTIGKRCKFVF